MSKKLKGTPHCATGKCNFKLICLFMFLLVVFSVNIYVVTQDYLPPVSERCSGDFSDYSVILDLPVAVMDGSLQVADATVYPPDTVWKADGLVFGCICSLRPCIKRCCPKGQSIINDSCFDIEHFDHVPRFFEVSSVKNQSQTLTVSENHFHILDGNCTEIHEYRHIVLSENGDLRDKEGSIIDDEEFCIDVDDYRSPEPIIVSCWENYFSRETNITRLRDTWRYSILVVSMVLLLVTLVVFVQVPRLQQGYGKCLMGYVFTQILRKAATIWFKASFPNEMDIVSGLKMTNIPETFADLSSHVWQLFIAHQIWTTFRQQRVKKIKSVRSNLIIRYCTFAFGMPIVLMVIWLLSVGSLSPEWADYKQDFFFTLTIMFCCTFLLLIMELASMAMCIAALCHLRRSMKLCENLQDSNTRRHNTIDIQWSSVFTKLSLITGLDYVLGNACQLLGYFSLFTNVFSIFFNTFFPVFYIINDFNNLRGVEIFFIFVFKKDVWESLVGKNFIRKRLLSSLLEKTR